MASKADLLAVLGHVAAGRLHPVVHAVMPLARAADAHRMLESARGVRQDRARAMTARRARSCAGLGKDYGDAHRGRRARSRRRARRDPRPARSERRRQDHDDLDGVRRDHADARHGHDRRRRSRDASRRAPSAKLGLVPQDLALYEELSASQNLRYFGALYGLARRGARRARSSGRSRSSGSPIARATRSRRTRAA